MVKSFSPPENTLLWPSNSFGKYRKHAMVAIVMSQYEPLLAESFVDEFLSGFSWK